jgi:serine protease AprX
MKKLLSLMILCFLATYVANAQAYIDEKLKAAMGGRLLPLQVVVTFKGQSGPSTLDIALLNQVGITQGLTLKRLPMAGIVATPWQIDALAKSSRVLSLYLNESLKPENEGATAITGVNMLRTDPVLTARNGGLPVSGKGIGILVNDSGVDGTHPDHEFGRNLVQNVMAAANLNAVVGILPYTAIENVPNTDATGGHGTHCAGTAGGTGRASGGKHEGVAPGASLIGYGSGAGLFILDVLSAFDYAITHQFEYNIRVITNSFGTTSDMGTAPNPADPITLATKRCVDRNIVVVFSAGNSGPGSTTITGNYKKAPWNICVGAGDKDGRLAGFSSRGTKGGGGSVSIDGSSFSWEDRPTIVAPGVDIVSTRAVSPLGVLGTDKDVEELEPAHIPYYTHMSGTSMACPHAAGIVALMLEANPSLTPAQVKNILQQTATNMPGREAWEVGAGYANAYAAVDMAARTSTGYGASLNLGRLFKSTVNVQSTVDNFVIDFDPAATSGNTYTFAVAEGTTGIEAKISAGGLLGETGNSVNLSLISPSGQEYRSGIPVLFATSYNRGAAVASPEAGIWTVKVSGLNGIAFPEKISGSVNSIVATGTSGMNDIAGHPAEASIKLAVSSRLADGLNGGYKPDELLKRIDLAEYLMMGQGIRQHLPVDGTTSLTDVKDRGLLAESVVANGAALRDRNHVNKGVMQPVSPGKFSPNTFVNRASLAYSLVQSLGLQKAALERNGKPVYVEVNGKKILVEDADKIPAGLEGYVSVALELNLINAYFSLSQGAYDFEPKLHAVFKPEQNVSRADFAVIITRTHEQWNNATQPTVSSKASNEEYQFANWQVTSTYPNPFTDKTTISYELAQDGNVVVEVYSVDGRKLSTLVSEKKLAGSHQVEFDGSKLPGGIYIYRVKANNEVNTNRMILNR